jgi:hypothetical protein
MGRQVIHDQHDLRRDGIIARQFRHEN